MSNRRLRLRTPVALYEFRPEEDVVTVRDDLPEGLGSEGGDVCEEVKPLPKPIELGKEHEGPRRRRGPDPLPDSVYEPFHRRMKREEMAMARSDKVRIQAEVEKLQTQRALLHQHDWLRHLVQMTLVDDQNAAELARKRQMTIDEIDRLLASHTDWLRRNTVFAAAVKAYEQGEASSDDEGDGTIEEIRQRRREKKKGYLRIRLGNGLELVLGPNKKPRVRKA